MTVFQQKGAKTRIRKRLKTLVTPAVTDNKVFTPARTSLPTRSPVVAQFEQQLSNQIGNYKCDVGTVYLYSKL